jgi:hypothetical protein
MYLSVMGIYIKKLGFNNASEHIWDEVTYSCLRFKSHNDGYALEIL